MESSNQLIVIIDTGYPSYKLEKELFQQEGYDLRIYEGDPEDVSQKMAFASDATGIMVRSTRICRDFLQSAPNLRAIVRYGVGHDNVDLEAAAERNIRVANVQGYANHTVSDHALSLMFACQRGLFQARKMITSAFGTPPYQDVFELHDKTLGIIGLGEIGSTFARKAGPFFRNTLASDPYVADQHFSGCGCIRTGLRDLLMRSHVISLHCNLTKETRHMINEEAFGLMKQAPILINTARGPVIRQEALLQALESGRIHSAGIDVWEDEPVTSRQEPLIDHPRMVSTGHIAWYSRESFQILRQRAAQNMIDLLNNKVIRDLLN